MPKWIPQLSKKKNCGQIALSVVTDLPLEEITKVVNKKGCTRTKDLVIALRKLGYSCPNRCRKFKLPLPNLAIAQLRIPYRKSGWHWVAIVNGRIYDGIFGSFDGTVKWPLGAKMTSLLPIEKS